MTGIATVQKSPSILKGKKHVCVINHNSVREGKWIACGFLVQEDLEMVRLGSTATAQGVCLIVALPKQ